jgi:hypothetical protein
VISFQCLSENVNEPLYVSVLFDWQRVDVLSPLDGLSIGLKDVLDIVDLVVDLNTELQAQNLVILVDWLLFSQAVVDRQQLPLDGLRD